MAHWFFFSIMVMSLEFFDDQRNYESYSIRNRKQEIIV